MVKRKCRNSNCDWEGNAGTCNPGNIDELCRIYTNYRCPNCYYLTNEVPNKEVNKSASKPNILKRFFTMFQ